MKTQINELERRGRLTISWLVNQVDEDGYLPCEGDLGCYYKVMYALARGGYPVHAAKVLNRTMQLHYQSNGDLRNSPEKKASGTYTSRFCQVYPNGWTILGANLIGRFDVVRQLTKGVIDNYYDEEMGTIRSCCTPRVDQFDANSAAMGAELFLLTDIERAKRCGDFLIKHLENQPDPDNWFHNRVEKPFNYITVPDPERPLYCSIKIGEPDQPYWFLGLSTIALTLLYEVTGDEKYLSGARRFFDKILACGDPGFVSTTSGKTFLASSMLYRITGEEIYKTSLMRLMEFFFSIQQQDGTFRLPGMTDAEADTKWHYDTAPEYARWFLEIAAELSTIGV